MQVILRIRQASDSNFKMIRLGVLFALVAAATAADSFDRSSLVSIQIKDEHKCNGVMISNTRVVTAASCFDGNTGSAWTVKASFATGRAAHSRGNVGLVITHHEYTPPEGEYALPVKDIAVAEVQFDESLGQPDWPKYLEWLNESAPTSALDLLDLSEATVYRWNTASDPEATSSDVSVTPAILVSTDSPSLFWGSVDPQFWINTLRATELNTNGVLGWISTNTGGPIVIDESVAGITSYGVRTTLGFPAGYLTVYTRTSPYLSWIHSQSSN